ncbi:MAG: ABC transporter ATP-binding protein [Chloroflexi bacterium]|nr:ABC transporter ATP-binding protein [Chloroflexota bacterium]
MLQLDSLRVAYGDVVAVQKATLNVDAGEIVALIGSNGAGKTTILKALSRLLPIAGGAAIFDGHTLNGLEPDRVVRLGLIQVPEGRRLFPQMTVQENLELGSFIPAAKLRRNQTMHEVFDLFPRLAERRTQLAGTLSGGEQQMCAIGRGLMALPKLLMLDEPSWGLAPIVVLQILDVIRHVRERGVTVLLVEQDVQHALQLADRAYVVENGHVTLEGQAADLLNSEDVRRAYLGM